MTPIEITKDRLTGLYNRTSFLPSFAEHLEQARKADQSLALALFDVDRFLRINDTFGHNGGDQVLIAVADLIRQSSPNVLAFRFGGDEIAALFPGWEREEAFLMVEQIRRAVTELRLTTAENEIIENITMSGGVAAFPVDGRTQVELIRKADQALYRAKSAGRNQVRLAFEEKMAPKTSHFTLTQLERLTKLSTERKTSEADLLREALDDLLTKYGVNDILS